MPEALPEAGPCAGLRDPRSALEGKTSPFPFPAVGAPPPPPAPDDGGAGAGRPASNGRAGAALDAEGTPPPTAVDAGAPVVVEDDPGGTLGPAAEDAAEMYEPLTNSAAAAAAEARSDSELILGGAESCRLIWVRETRVLVEEEGVEPELRDGASLVIPPRPVPALNRAGAP